MIVAKEYLLNQMMTLCVIILNSHELVNEKKTARKKMLHFSFQPLFEAASIVYEYLFSISYAEPST